MTLSRIEGREMHPEKTWVGKAERGAGCRDTSPDGLNQSMAERAHLVGVNLDMPRPSCCAHGSGSCQRHRLIVLRPVHPPPQEATAVTLWRNAQWVSSDPSARASGRRAETLAPGLRSVKWLLLRVPPKTQQGPRLLSRGAPQFPSTIECRLDPC